MKYLNNFCQILLKTSISSGDVYAFLPRTLLGYTKDSSIRSSNGVCPLSLIIVLFIFTGVLLGIRSNVKRNDIFG